MCLKLCYNIMIFHCILLFMDGNSIKAMREVFMMKMDESKTITYKVGKQIKILKQASALRLLLLVFLSGFILTLSSCNVDDDGKESQGGGVNNENTLEGHPDDLSDGTDPVETDLPTNAEQMRDPIVFCGSSDPDNAVMLTDEQALSYLALVNNCYRVGSEFSPSDLSPVYVESRRVLDEGSHHLMRETAARAAEELFQDAEANGVFLVASSGYRSYNWQEFFYEQAVNSMGLEEARRVSAVPGHSEHQLGLALDISTRELDGELIQEFAETPEGMWVNENAHRFGFIISYPYGREADTGIMYEPWHIRYVGVEVATDIFNKGQILEEYLWYYE